MPTFDYTFTVPAPLQAVSDFHHDTRVLKRLSPPPVFVDVQAFEPLREGAEARFTMWFGPIPARWHAVHVDVGNHGFTDVQLHGPLARWQHTHRFSAVDANRTQIHEHIEFEHAGGPRGLLTRLVFNRPGLSLLFTYRQLVTRWALASSRWRWTWGSLGALLALVFIVAAWRYITSIL